MMNDGSMIGDVADFIGQSFDQGSQEMLKDKHSIGSINEYDIKKSL